MGKYAPLGEFLRKQKATLVPLTFARIEEIVGTKLPASQRYPAWWSNNPFNNVMTQVWLDAGFETEQVDIERGRVVFRRMRDPQAGLAEAPREYATKPSSAIHPLVGWMTGTATIAPGVDLTEPADPEWGARVWGDEK
jgi:hypothetical protein